MWPEEDDIDAALQGEASASVRGGDVSQTVNWGRIIGLAVVLTAIALFAIGGSVLFPAR